jgi:hypothetical protein
MIKLTEEEIREKKRAYSSRYREIVGNTPVDRFYARMPEEERKLYKTKKQEYDKEYRARRKLTETPEQREKRKESDRVREKRAYYKRKEGK